MDFKTVKYIGIVIAASYCLHYVWTDVVDVATKLALLRTHQVQQLRSSNPLVEVINTPMAQNPGRITEEELTE